MPEGLKVPDLPEYLRPVWLWFAELSSGRGGNGFGANPISWRDICDWQEVTGIRLAPWEIRAIRAIDQAFLSEQGKNNV